jgi:hypothetical protein
MSDGTWEAATAADWWTVQYFLLAGPSLVQVAGFHDCLQRGILRTLREPLNGWEEALRLDRPRYGHGLRTVRTAAAPCLLLSDALYAANSSQQRTLPPNISTQVNPGEVLVTLLGTPPFNIPLVPPGEGEDHAARIVERAARATGRDIYPTSPPRYNSPTRKDRPRV